MKRIKDKDTEILESELTIIGFIFFMMWLVFNLELSNIQNKNLNNQLIEAKAIAVEYYESEKLALDMVQSLNDALDEAEIDLENYKYLERILKDLDRSETRDAN